MYNLLDELLLPMTEKRRQEIADFVRKVNKNNPILGRLTMSAKISNISASLSKDGLASISRQVEWDALRYSSAAFDNLIALLKNPTIAIYTQGVIMVTYAIITSLEAEEA